MGNILACTQAIAAYTENVDELTFIQSGLIRDAVIHRLVVLGEACNTILKHHPNFETQYPSIPILKPYDLRNVLVHEYARVDYELLWSITQNEVTDLQSHIQAQFPNVLPIDY